MAVSGFTVVVRCSDPRLESFFTSPAKRVELGLAPSRGHLAEAYIANVGGLWPFTDGGENDLAADAGLLLGLFAAEAPRVVLTAHSSCGGYLQRTGKEESAVYDRQLADIRAAAKVLVSALPGVNVSAYYLEIDTHRVEQISL